MKDRVIEVVVLDFDGTLVSKDAPDLDLDDTTFALLSEARRRGMLLFIATGRHPSYIKKRIKHFDFDAIVGYSGNFIEHGDEVNYYRFKKEDIMVFNDFFSNHQNIRTTLYSPLGIATCETYEMIEHEKKRLSSKRVIDLNGVRDITIETYLTRDEVYDQCRYAIRFSDFTQREEISKLFEERFENFRLVKTGDKQVEIFNKNYSKASRLEELINRMSIERDHIITIGDDENDYEMLKRFTSFYVGDAKDQRLMEVATYTTSSCIDALKLILESRK